MAGREGQFLMDILKSNRDMKIGYVGTDLLFERYRYRHLVIQDITKCFPRFRLASAKMVINVFDSCMPE